MEETYPNIDAESVAQMTRQEAHANYRYILTHMTDDIKHNTLRMMVRDDAFFRLVYMLNIVPREVIDNDWVYERCAEVSKAPWGYVDLWAREHFKTTIITQNGTIGDILADPEGTQAIFSFNRPQAKKITAPIVHELESNPWLHELFPDILWDTPATQAPKWSENEGYILKREYNPTAPTLYSGGLDSQPIGLHFKRLRYDDVETDNTVSTPEMLEATDQALKLSYNLGITGMPYKSWVGTIYTFNDIYTRLINDKVGLPRIYPATKNGKRDGDLYLWTRDQFEAKWREMGPYIASCQLLLDPVVDGKQSLMKEWLRYWKADHFDHMNRYITVDPASEKKKSSDYTTFTVHGLGYDRNYYVIRQIRDRLNLKQRVNVLFQLVDQYKPIMTGYEKYGLQADIEHIQEQQEIRNFRFPIVPLGGSMAKIDRIKRGVPYLSEHRVYFPEAQPYQQYDGKLVDLTKSFVNDEYLAFPFGSHDDMLDGWSRIFDDAMSAYFPEGPTADPFEIESRDAREESYDFLWSGMK